MPFKDKHFIFCICIFVKQWKMITAFLYAFSRESQIINNSIRRTANALFRCFVCVCVFAEGMAVNSD